MQEESSDFIHDLGCDDELAAVTDGERYFAFAAGDFDKARIAFACAWPVVRSPLVLFELAVAEEQSDVLAGALRALPRAPDVHGSGRRIHARAHGLRLP